jgi:hypothetical protein
VGGVWGYEALLEALRSPETPEQRELLEWAGRFDPEAVDLDAINRGLAWLRPGSPGRELSRPQIARLLQDDWSGGGVVRLRQDLVLEQVDAAPTLHNARAFLALLAEEDGLGATQSGNLNRAAVGLLLERLRWPEGYLEELHRYNKVIDERDAWMLHRLRVLRPLSGFGLVEEREEPGERPYLPRHLYRRTVLFDRFLRFSFSG